MTAPYKLVVAGLCDEVEADAKAIGAVNNVATTRRRASRRLQHRRARLPGRGRAGDGPSDRRRARSSWPARAARRTPSCTPASRPVPPGSPSATGPPARRPRAGAVLDDRRPARAAVALDDPAFRAATMNADLAVNATTVGMLEPGVTIPVERLPGPRHRVRPRLRARRDAAAARGSRTRPAGRPTAPRCSSPRRPSRSSAGPAWRHGGRDARRGRAAPRRSAPATALTRDAPSRRDGPAEPVACRSTPSASTTATRATRDRGPGTGRPADLRQERERRWSAAWRDDRLGPLR